MSEGRESDGPAAKKRARREYYVYHLDSGMEVEGSPFSQLNVVVDQMNVLDPGNKYWSSKISTLVDVKAVGKFRVFTEKQSTPLKPTQPKSLNSTTTQASSQSTKALTPVLSQLRADPGASSSSSITTSRSPHAQNPFSKPHIQGERKATTPISNGSRENLEDYGSGEKRIGQSGGLFLGKDIGGSGMERSLLDSSRQVFNRTGNHNTPSPAPLPKHPSNWLPPNAPNQTITPSPREISSNDRALDPLISPIHLQTVLLSCLPQKNDSPTKAEKKRRVLISLGEIQKDLELYENTRRKLEIAKEEVRKRRIVGEDLLKIVTTRMMGLGIEEGAAVPE